MFFFRGLVSVVRLCMSSDSSASSVNSIGAAGAAAVCQALEKNTTLQSLNLNCECAAAQRVMHVFVFAHFGF